MVEQHGPYKWCEPIIRSSIDICPAAYQQVDKRFQLLPVDGLALAANGDEGSAFVTGGDVWVGTKRGRK